MVFAQVEGFFRPIHRFLVTVRGKMGLSNKCDEQVVSRIFWIELQTSFQMNYAFIGPTGVVA